MCMIVRINFIVNFLAARAAIVAVAISNSAQYAAFRHQDHLLKSL